MQSVEHLPAAASDKVELVGAASSPSGGRCDGAGGVFATVGLQLYGSPEISGRECRFDLGHIIGATYKASEAGAQATAQSERIRPWLVANRFQAISQASMTLARLGNTELASQWLRR